MQADGCMLGHRQHRSQVSPARRSSLVGNIYPADAAAHGIPWRRGYLFYGPPGSGKTSLVTALAGRLHKSIYVVNLSSPAMNDEVGIELVRLHGA